MAAIDKTYVNESEWNLAKKFHQETLDQQIKELPTSISLYYDEFPGGDECVLWNTSRIQDIWLWKNCQLDFIKERLKFQYGEGYFNELSNLITFEQNYVSLVEIDSEPYYFPLFYQVNDTEVEMFEPSDEILIYGSTNWLEVLDYIKNFTFSTKRDIEFSICYYGAILTYKNGDWFDENDNQLKSNISWFDSELHFPKINHSLDSNDVLKVPNKHFIFIADESGIHPITDYKNLPDDLSIIQKWINSGRFGIPRYIHSIIK